MATVYVFFVTVAHFTRSFISIDELPSLKWYQTIHTLKVYFLLTHSFFCVCVVARGDLFSLEFSFQQQKLKHFNGKKPHLNIENTKRWQNFSTKEICGCKSGNENSTTHTISDETSTALIIRLFAICLCCWFFILLLVQPFYVRV